MNIPKKPQRGQKALQSIYNSVCQIIDYLPTLTVTGDNKTTYVNHSAGGQVIHAVQKDTVIPGGKKEYEAGSGLTLSGNVFNNDVTSGRFIEVTSAYEINCTLSGGNNIEITPNGVINCTLTGGGGGGGGNTYYADNYTLSTTTSGGTTFCMYDVYPLITGGGGTTVSRYGDAPGYPGFALGTIISSPYYVGASGIGILDDTTPGTYNKYVAITANFDYNAGTGISIDPTTRTINCTVEPGGGGTYYGDEYTIKLSSTNNTFYLYDVEPLLTGAGGIIVYNYGTDELSRRVTGISATPYTGGSNISVDNYVISMTATIPTKTSDLTNDSGYITISDLPPGTSYTADGVTLSTTNATCTQFCLYDVLPLLTGGGGVTVAAYGSAPGYPDYARGTIISCPVYLPSTGIAIVDDQTEGTYNKYIAVTGGVSTPIQPGSGLISTAHTDPNSNPYYPTITSITFDLSAHFYNDLISLSGRHNFGGGVILSSSNGNLVWAQNITKVSQLTNDAGYITSPGPAPTAYYADNDTLSTTDDGTKFYVRNISTLLTGAGGTTVYYYGTGLNNTVIAGISSYTYLPSTGIGLIDGEAGTSNKYIAITGNFDYTGDGGVQVNPTTRVISLSTTIPTKTSDLTNDSNYITLADIPPSTTYIGTSGIVIEPILDENQQPTTSSTIGLSTVYDLLSEGPNIKLTKLADGRTQISGTPEGSGGGGGSGDWTNVYVFDQGIINVQPNTRYLVCLDPVLLRDKNDIENEVSENQIRYYYKYLFRENSQNNQVIIETVQRYNSEYEQWEYGYYWNGQWEDYDTAGCFGVQFIFPSSNVATSVQIICCRHSNVALTAPQSVLVDAGGWNPISGTTGTWIALQTEMQDQTYVFNTYNNGWWYCP